MDANNNPGGGSTLPPMQELFCREYIVDWNKTAAAKRAGYAEGSAHTIAYDLFKETRIRNRITELLSERRSEYAATIERVQEELGYIAFMDATEVWDALFSDGVMQPKDLKALPQGIRAAIKSIERTKFGLKIAFYDKMAALDMFARHFGFYAQDNAQKQQEGPRIYMPDNGRGGADAGGTDTPGV